MSQPPSNDDPPGFGRRAFLKTGVAGAAATGVVGLALQPAQAQVLGPGPVALSLKVNGQVRAVTVEPRTTLLRALRGQLDLTGAKEVCERGSCGACTVLLDGRPVCSCLLLAADAEGHEITTVEGLGTPEALSPLQQAFVECDALQCGYCTPGFVVAGTALLRETPQPSLEQVQAGLAGNLCRCGTYSRIFEAVQKAARSSKLGG